MAIAEAKPHQYSHAEKKRFRKSFGRQADKMEIPNLLEIQLKSYRDFLHTDTKLSEQHRYRFTCRILICFSY